MTHPKIILAALVWGVLLPTALLPAQQVPDELLTVAEASEFTATSRHQQVVDFIDACAARAEHVSRFNFGQTVEGRPMVAAIVDRSADGPPFTGFRAPPLREQRPDKLRILLLGNIHPGECAGKESLLMLLRDMTLEPDHRWLQDAVIIIAPNYNADGNERIGDNQNHRPGQIGPEQGMGVRENAQQLDLNRDFVKLDSPEGRALVSLIDQFDPHLFIDCHTTNGSRHRYALTYDIPHNPSAPQPIRDFLRNRMMPEITDQLEAEGVSTFYYGNLSRDASQWTTFGHEPRYSTEYVGLRGRLGILSEAYSYISYRERIEASRAFVSAVVGYVHKHRDSIMSLIADGEKQFVERAAAEPNSLLVHLNAQPVAFEEKFTIKAYDGEAPADYSVDFIGNYQPARTVVLPWAYLIPEHFSRAVERLRMHGIQVEQTATEANLEVEMDHITSVSRASGEFQRHQMVELQTQRVTAPHAIPAGTYLVRTAQPLGMLAAYLLEPTSDDGLVTWNFLDQWLTEGADYPIVRISTPTELATRPVLRVAPKTRLTLDMVLANEQSPATTDSEVDWVEGTDQLLQSWSSFGRKFQIQVDAASGAMQRYRQPWNERAVRSALASLLADDQLAGTIAQSKPLVTTDQQTLVFSHDGGLYVYRIADDRAFRIGGQETIAELPQISPDQQQVAYVSAGNLYVADLQDGHSLALTDSGSDELLHGKLDWVYQEELYGRGNFSAFWWSPDSRRLAFLRLDERSVPRYTVKDDIPVRGRVEVTPYPKAGDPLPKVDVGVVAVEGGNIAWAELKLYDDDQLLVSRVGWNKAGDRVLIQVQNRQQTWLDLCTMEPLTGSLQQLFRDQTPAWIESPGDPVWLADGSFLWKSPRDGFDHIYHYAADGSLLSQVTHGPWQVASIIGVTADDQAVFFTGQRDDAVRVQAFRCLVDGSQLQQLTNLAGSHEVNFNHDFTYFIDRHSEMGSPARVALVRADGQFMRYLVPQFDDQLEYLEVARPKFFKVPTRDNDWMDAAMIVPPDFDPAKKYPVLVNVYSGPQAPTVVDRYGRAARYLWHQMLAQHGYIIWMCDNRSATSRGAKYAWPIHRQMGTQELHDIEDGVRWLAQEPWVDKERIGIWGWSYGGYMTAYAMTHSDLFKAGISGAPVTDWSNYDAIYTERYMDTPQNNADGYRTSSVLDAAENLHGRMLLVHGAIDDNVHLSNTMQLALQLQKAGKSFDLMIYPENRHGIRQTEQVRHLYQTMTEFILNNL